MLKDVNTERQKGRKTEKPKDRNASFQDNNQIIMNRNKVRKTEGQTDRKTHPSQFVHSCIVCSGIECPFMSDRN